MNRVAKLLSGMLLAMAATAPAQAINDAYIVSGDGPALPIQAFDDGRWLYVQLRDPMNPPAPVGPNGPIAYQMRGPYIVVPMMPSLSLHLGGYRASVTAHGAADYAPGIVSITAPVQVPLTPRVPYATAPVPVTQPSHFTDVGSTAGGAVSMDGGVSGEIVVAGPTGTTNSRASGGTAGLTLDYSAAAAQTAYTSRAPGLLTLRADGTSTGAEAVLKARTACQAAGRECAVEYRGAPSGQITIVENNG